MLIWKHKHRQFHEIKDLKMASNSVKFVNDNALQN